MHQRRTQPPKRIRILNLTWAVKFVDNDVSDSLGWCDYDSQTITLYARQSNESLCDTFQHEILHALFYAMSIDSKTDEEKVVSKISTGLNAVWSQNPKAFKWYSSLL
jgi:hypothetical protein